jgi:hypothetical protein
MIGTLLAEAVVVAQGMVGTLLAEAVGIVVLAQPMIGPPVAEQLHDDKFEAKTML